MTVCRARTTSFDDLLPRVLVAAQGSNQLGTGVEWLR